MPLRLLPSLLMLILAWGFSPGPANIYAMGCSILYGRQRALSMWWGLLCGFSTAALAAAFVTHWIGPEMTQWVDYLRYCGAAFILWLAYTTLRPHKDGAKSQRSCNFLTGFTVQLTNAKIILFDFMVFTLYVLPYSTRFVDLLVAATLLLIAGPGANLAWLLAGSSMHTLLESRQHLVRVAMATMLAVCAILIIIG
ncbi:MAG: LysE family transporter [Prevotella sp.]|nr:LysE family transporter [Prevotella sp.]